MPVFEWFEVSCLFFLYGLSFVHPFYPFHSFPACRKQTFTDLESSSNVQNWSLRFKVTITKVINKVIVSSDRQRIIFWNDKYGSALEPGDSSQLHILLIILHSKYV